MLSLQATDNLLAMGSNLQEMDNNQDTVNSFTVNPQFSVQRAPYNT